MLLFFVALFVHINEDLIISPLHVALQNPLFGKSNECNYPSLILAALKYQGLKCKFPRSLFSLCLDQGYSRNQASVLSYRSFRHTEGQQLCNKWSRLSSAKFHLEFYL